MFCVLSPSGTYGTGLESERGGNQAYCMCGKRGTVFNLAGPHVTKHADNYNRLNIQVNGARDEKCITL